MNPRAYLLPTALLCCAVLLASSAPAHATFASDYQYSEGTGTAVSMVGATSIATTSDDDGSQTSAPYSIGFDFVFDGTTYSTFSLNSNGLIKLGGTSVVSGTRFNEDFPTFGPSSNDFPFLAPFWDDLYSHGDKIRYVLTGSAPNRVLTIEYHTEKYSFNNLEDLRMQVRLYETSNVIEFYYDTFTTEPGANTFNGFVGLATSTSNYVRVIPGTPATFSSSGSGTVTPPAPGTLYTFTPCLLTLDVEADRDLLTPNNQSMVTVNLAVNGSSSCGAPTYRLVSVTSSEADAGVFAGDIAGDIANATVGAADTQFDLRAESGSSGRVYTVVYRVDNGTGSLDRSIAILVPPTTAKFATAPAVTSPKLTAVDASPSWTLSSTTLSYTLGATCAEKVMILRPDGRVVRTLLSGAALHPAGTYTVSWDGTDALGVPVPEGAYVIDIKARGERRLEVVYIDR